MWSVKQSCDMLFYIYTIWQTSLSRAVFCSICPDLYYVTLSRKKHTVHRTWSRPVYCYSWNHSDIFLIELLIILIFTFLLNCTQVWQIKRTTASRENSSCCQKHTHKRAVKETQPLTKTRLSVQSHLDHETTLNDFIIISGLTLMGDDHLVPLWSKT